MATELLATLGTGQDFSLPSVAEAAIGTTNLTLASTLVFSHGGITGSLAAGDDVIQDNTSATGTIQIITATQVLLVSVSGTFNATDVVREVGQSGNNYTPSDTGDDCRVVFRQSVDELISDSMTMSGVIGNTNADPNCVIFDVLASVKSPQNYGTKFRMESSQASNPVIDITGSGYVLKGYAVRNTSATSPIGIRKSNVFSDIRECIVDMDGTGSSAGVDNDGAGRCVNNIVMAASDGYTGSGDFTANGAYRCGNGFNLSNGTAQACVSYNNTGTDFAGTYSAGSTWDNASQDGTSPSFFPITAVDADFVDQANDDYTLASGSQLLGAQTFADLTEDEPAAFFDRKTPIEFRGETRPTASNAFDVGPMDDTQVSAGSIAITTHPTRHITRDNTGALGESEAGFTDRKSVV